MNVTEWTDIEVFWERGASDKDRYAYLRDGTKWAFRWIGAAPYSVLMEMHLDHPAVTAWFEGDEAYIAARVQQLCRYLEISVSGAGEMLALFTYHFENQTDVWQDMGRALIDYLKGLTLVDCLLRGVPPLLEADGTPQLSARVRETLRGRDPSLEQTYMGVGCAQTMGAGNYQMVVQFPIKAVTRILELEEQDAPKFSRWFDLCAHVIGASVEVTIELIEKNGLDESHMRHFGSPMQAIAKVSQLLRAQMSLLSRQHFDAKESPKVVVPANTRTELWVPGPRRLLT